MLTSEIILLFSSLYYPFELTLKIYIKSLSLSITGLTGGVAILLNKSGIPNPFSKDKNNKIKQQEIIKQSIPLFAMCTIVAFINYYVFNWDFLRITISMLVLLIGYLLINLSNKKSNLKNILDLTGNMFFVVGGILLLNEIIIILVRCSLGMNNMTFLEMFSWTNMFININSEIDTYLDIFSISVIIAISMATVIIAKRMIKNNKINDRKMKKIEKKLKKMKKIEKEFKKMEGNN
ncbi:hypothetical protein [Methanimicrococcus hacksteinii]|nr:hypothetical protein [Methanimicrococcus sp. At1]